MSILIVPRLLTQSGQWKGHWRPVPPTSRRILKPSVEGLEARALMASITEYPITAGNPSPPCSDYGRA